MRGASPVGTYYRATYKLNELKAHMRWVVGNGNEGKIQEIEGRVDRHEAYLQRFTGIGAALASLLTLFHFAIDYLALQALRRETSAQFPFEQSFFFFFWPASGSF